MIVTIKRTYNCATYCISHIYVDDVYVCDAIEDVDRMLDDSMPTLEIQAKKVYAKTAIPTGTYRLTLNVVSPSFSKKTYYMNFCKGKLPRVLNVKGFDGILWHKGNTEKDSAGCLILGYNKVKGKVINSQQAFEKLYKILDEANKKNEKIYAKYIRTYTK